MACSPDGSQSVWKRTLSAASAVAARTNGPATAASSANARIAYFIWVSCARRGSGEQRLYQTESIIESKDKPDAMTTIDRACGAIAPDGALRGRRKVRSVCPNGARERSESRNSE